MDEHDKDIIRLQIFMNNLRVCEMESSDIIIQGFHFAVQMGEDRAKKLKSERPQTGPVVAMDILSIKEHAVDLLTEVLRSDPFRIIARGKQ